MRDFGMGSSEVVRLREGLTERETTMAEKPGAVTYSALYYPFIHFKDDNWLKLCALYWDKMGRIVPSGYKTEDSDTVRALGDFIEILDPDWATPECGKIFVDFIEEYGSRLRERFGIDKLNEWPKLPPGRKAPPAGGRVGHDDRLGYIFYEKMTDDLRTKLVDSGVAVEVPGPEDKKWIAMHPTLADVYMTALADQLAGERGFCPLTDEILDHIAVSGCTVERLAQVLIPDVDLVKDKENDKEVEMLAASVALQSVLPRDLDQLPVDRILEFRSNYPFERSAFQKLIADFLEPREWLNEIKNRRDLIARLESEYEKTLKPKLDELRQKLHDVRIDTIYGCFNAKLLLPSLAPKAAAALGMAIEPITAAALGFAWVTIPILRDKRKVMKQTLRSADVSFLYQLDEQLRPKSLADRMKSDVNRFVFGA
jgi:Family of unknown function (DUF6236)